MQKYIFFGKALIYPVYSVYKKGEDKERLESSE